MIKLDILGDFCQDCPDFDPVSYNNHSYIYANAKQVMIDKTETLVTCRHKERCSRIYEHLKKCIDS